VLNTALHRQEPRIAEVKLQEKQLKSARDKQVQDNQVKMHNENLVLRNFKKEFDLLMSEVGLGPAPPQSKESLMKNETQEVTERHRIQEVKKPKNSRKA